MSVNELRLDWVEQFSAWYGNGDAGDCPKESQWKRVADLAPDKPFALINFFRFRSTALYSERAAALSDGRGPGEAPVAGNVTNRTPLTGREAFDLYAAVSVPTMERVGGRFLHVGPAVGSLLGEEENWDLVAIGRYPDLDAFIGLYGDPDYREAFLHRKAACACQRVYITAG